MPKNCPPPLKSLPMFPFARMGRAVAPVFIGWTLLACASAASAKPYGPGTGSAAAHMASSAAVTCEARSPEHRVALVELFTSEGCSSCPPADRWLSRLRPGEGRFDAVVPLSLHVGYWDYIGWKDPYAQARFTDRQRDYARLRGATSVYTPQVVVSGQDFRAWNGPAFERELAALRAQPATVGLELAGSAVGSAVQVRLNATTRSPAAGAAPAQKTAQTVTAAPAPGTPRAHIALFEMGLKSAVTRGENRGETLGHDFVVRHWHGPFELKPGGLAVKDVLSLDAPANGRSMGVAAFVQDASGAVLQATACLMQ